MAWEITDQHVDKALALHRFVLADKDTGRQHRFDVMLGAGHDGASCPHCGGTVKFGYTLNEKGALVDKDGKELDPRELAKQRVAALNGFHARMEKHAARHGAPVRKTGSREQGAGVRGAGKK